MSDAGPREWWAVLEDEYEDGYSNGTICSDGGGNLYWQDNQFKVIEKSAYDALSARVRELEQYNKGLMAQVDSLVENPETEVLQRKIAELEAEYSALLTKHHSTRILPPCTKCEELEAERDEFRRKWKSVSLQLNDANDQIEALEKQVAELKAELKWHKKDAKDVASAMVKNLSDYCDRLKQADKDNKWLKGALHEQRRERNIEYQRAEELNRNVHELNQRLVDRDSQALELMKLGEQFKNERDQLQSRLAECEDFVQLYSKLDPEEKVFIKNTMADLWRS